LPVEPEDALEANKMWSFVQEKCNQRWIWAVMCRCIHQIVAFVIGDQVEVTAIFGKPTNLFFLWKHMNALGKGASRPITWNVGSAP
jgi:hypothetical protein